MINTQCTSDGGHGLRLARLTARGVGHWLYAGRAVCGATHQALRRPAPVHAASGRCAACARYRLVLVLLAGYGRLGA